MEWVKWIYSLTSAKGWTIIAYILSVILCSIFAPPPFILGALVFSVVNAFVFLVGIGIHHLIKEFAPEIIRHFNRWWDRRPQKK